MWRASNPGMHWSARKATGTVVVNEAETGRKLSVELVQGEDGADVLRAKLYRATRIPPENQILLWGGPPFKALRSHLPHGVINTTTATATGGGSTQNPGKTATSTLATSSYYPVVSDSSDGGGGGGSSSNSIDDEQKIFLFDWRTLAPERSVPASPVISGASFDSPLGGEDSENALSSAAAAAAAAAAQAAEAEAAEYIGPVEVLLPTHPRAAPSPLPSAEGSVLLATIANYERGSMLALNRGQNYADSSAGRLKGGELCVERMQTQIEALGAAVSNSLDHWEPLQRGYMGLSEKLEEQALRHQAMLETFEEHLGRLGTIPLHPSLAAASLLATTMSSSGSGGAGGGGGGGGGGSSSSREERSTSGRSETALSSEGTASAPGLGDRGSGALRREDSEGGGGVAVSNVTLLDCVPVERELRLLESCRTSQRRFRQEAEAVAQKYSAIKSGLEEQRDVPVTGNGMVEGLCERARELCREQERRRGELEANYRESFTRATQEKWTGDQEKQDAIQRMTELTVTQERIVPLMKDIDQQVMETIVEIARAKATVTTTLRRRLREVSKLQTDIGKIQKHQELVGMAWGQKEEQFEHLGKVARMPAAYKAFLLEVLRHRRYHKDFETKVAEFCGAMEALRSSEIAARQAFRETHLGNLPPVFLEMAPGLRQLPPVFAPPTTPLFEGELPDIRPPDVEAPEDVRPEPLVADEQAVGVSAHSSEAEPQVAATADKAGDVAPPAQSEQSKTVAVDASTSAAVAAVVEAADGAEASAVVVEARNSAEASAVVVEASKVEERECQAGPAWAEDSAVGVVGDKHEVMEAERGDDDDSEAERRKQAYSSLEAENARLLEELARAQSRLDRLEHEQNKAADAAASNATATATGTASVSGHAETATSASVSDPPPLPPPPPPAPAPVSPAVPLPPPEGATVISEVVEALESDRRRSVSAAGTRAEGSAAVTAEALGAGDVDVRHLGGAVAATGRGSGGRRSSGATQSQLAAYRAGLSMLVKLADQLAAAAAASGAGAGVSGRGDWEVSTPTAARRSLGAAATEPASAVASEPESTAASQTAAPQTAIVPPVSPSSGVDSFATAGAAGAEAANSTADTIDVAGTESDRPGDKESNAPSTTSAADAPREKSVATEEGGDGGSSAGVPPLADDTTVDRPRRNTEEGDGDGRDALTIGDNRNEDKHDSSGSVGTGGGEGGGEDNIAAAGESQTGDSSGTTRSAEVGGGAEPSQEPSVTHKQTDEEGVAVGSQSASTSASVATDSTVATTTSATLTSSVSAGKLSEKDTVASGAAADRVVGDRVGRTDGVKGDVDGISRPAVTAPAGKGSSSVPARVAGGGRGVSGGGGGADVDRIRKAAEHVAGNLRRMHGRIEQLLPFEALASVPRISMCSFDVQDIALFLPTMVGPPDGSAGTVFLAFHVNCPNRYLSEDSINIARQNLGSCPAYILGRIIMIERHVGSEEPNPYNVANKTVYYVLTAENVC